MSHHARSCLIVGLVQTPEPKYAAAVGIIPRKEPFADTVCNNRKGRSDLILRANSVRLGDKSHVITKSTTKAKEETHMSTFSSLHKHHEKNVSRGGSRVARTCLKPQRTASSPRVATARTSDMFTCNHKSTVDELANRNVSKLALAGHSNC